MNQKTTALNRVLSTIGVCIFALTAVAVSAFMPIPVYVKEIEMGEIVSTAYASSMMGDSDAFQVDSISENRILGIPVEPGDEVKKGDILCIYDGEENPELNNLLSEIYQMRKGYTDYAHTGMPALNYSEQMERIEQAEMQLQNYEERLTEAKNTLDDVRASGGEVDKQIEDDYLSMKAQYDNQLDTIASLKKDMEADKLEDQQMMDSTIKALAYLNKKTREIQSTIRSLDTPKGSVIASPVDGAVQEVYAQMGKSLPIGNAILSVVSAEEGYNLAFTIPPDFASGLRVGDIVPISSYYWNIETEGNITEIGNPENDGIPIKVKCKSNKGYGHSVSIKLEKKNTYSACIPLYAVHSSDDGEYIYIIKDRLILGGRIKVSTVEKRKVTVVETSDSVCAIRENLAGRRLILNDSPLLNARRPVRIIRY